MLIYLAGMESNENRQVAYEVGNRNFLMSYFYLENKCVAEMFPYATEKVNVFLDSGGYTARKKGVKINLDDYIQYIKTNKDWITAYANFDESNLEDTLKNQKRMEEAGLQPLPVFHGVLS